MRSATGTSLGTPPRDSGTTTPLREGSISTTSANVSEPMERLLTQITSENFVLPKSCVGQSLPLHLVLSLALLVLILHLALRLV